MRIILTTFKFQLQHLKKIWIHSTHPFRQIEYETALIRPVCFCVHMCGFKSTYNLSHFLTKVLVTLSWPQMLSWPFKCYLHVNITVIESIQHKEVAILWNPSFPLIASKEGSRRWDVFSLYNFHMVLRLTVICRLFSQVLKLLCLYGLSKFENAVSSILLRITLNVIYHRKSALSCCLTHP